MALLRVHLRQAMNHVFSQLDEMLSRLMDHITDPSELAPPSLEATDLNVVSDVCAACPLVISSHAEDLFSDGDSC